MRLDISSHTKFEPSVTFIFDFELNEKTSIDSTFQIWYDVANGLVREEVEFRLNHDADSWEEKCLSFSSKQIHIQLDEVSSFTKVFKLNTCHQFL